MRNDYSMRAIYQNGVIEPLDPVPDSWSEGQELIVEACDELKAPAQSSVDELGTVLEEEHRIEKAGLRYMNALRAQLDSRRR